MKRDLSREALEKMILEKTEVFNHVAEEFQKAVRGESVVNPYRGRFLDFGVDLIRREAAKFSDRGTPLSACRFCGTCDYRSAVTVDLSNLNRDEFAVRCEFCGAFGPPADTPEGARNLWDMGVWPI